MTPRKIGKVYGTPTWGRLKKQAKVDSRRVARRRLNREVRKNG